MIAATLFFILIGSLILTIVLLLYSRLRARGSVDRASGSGPEERGFESLRAHTIKKQQTSIICLLLFSLGLLTRRCRVDYLTCRGHLDREDRHNRRCGHHR